ncbi:MAG: hypothetical protein ACD_73C00141G0006 [uncultured bacterium]|nr:MAG: hypothetical protein ACD_73C00141G0006 [uncultured bacterium]
MPSFDISSEVDLQEVDNAVNQAIKEITTRYDFRGSKSTITFDKSKNTITLLADDDFKMKSLQDVLLTRTHKRGISIQALKMGDQEKAGGDMVRCVITLIMEIETEKAKEIMKAIKESKLKVQSTINESKVRVSGKNRDDLQEAIALVKGKDFKIPLQFGNFRE